MRDAYLRPRLVRSGAGSQNSAHRIDLQKRLDPPSLSANVRETRSTQELERAKAEKTNMLGLRERMEENGSAPGTGEAKRSAAAPADPEVVDRPLRRRFSPSYKLRIVEEADRCTEPGEVGQLLRREGLRAPDDVAQGGA